MLNIDVTCYVDRKWDIHGQEYAGIYKEGKLISFNRLSDGEKDIPVGIVMFIDNRFEAVPLEFITASL